MPQTSPPLAEPAPADDRRTVELAGQGDHEARERLARACQFQAYRFALQLTSNQDDALDVAQEAMVRFFQSLHRFDTSRPVRPWLLRIVRNLVHDLRRRQKVRRADSLDDDTAAVLVEPSAPGPGPEALAERHELQRLVWLELQGLPPRYREVLVLRDYLDMPYAEIVFVLRAPRGTVMSRLHRGRLMLRRAVLTRLGRADLAGKEGHDA